MSNAIIYLGPSSLSKHASINTYANSYPGNYILSTLDLHLMFEIYDFKNFSHEGYMTVAANTIGSIIDTLVYKRQNVIIKDWYLNYVLLEHNIQKFDRVELRIFNSPLDCYLSFYHQVNPWNKKLPDVLDEIFFYEQFQTFIKSPLVNKLRKDHKVTITGLKTPVDVYS